MYIFMYYVYIVINYNIYHDDTVEARVAVELARYRFALQLCYGHNRYHFSCHYRRSSCK